MSIFNIQEEKNLTCRSLSMEEYIINSIGYNLIHVEIIADVKKETNCSVLAYLVSNHALQSEKILCYLSEWRGLGRVISAEP